MPLLFGSSREWEYQADTARNGAGRLVEHNEQTGLVLQVGHRLPGQVFRVYDINSTCVMSTCVHIINIYLVPGSRDIWVALESA